MKKVGLSEAARLSGKSRSTVHRSIKSGVLSASKDAKGHTLIDVSELERVYGVLRRDTVKNESETHDATHDETQELRTRVAFLEAEIKAKDELIETLRENLSDLRTRLEKSDELIASTITQKRLGWFGSMFGKRS